MSESDFQQQHSEGDFGIASNVYEVRNLSKGCFYMLFTSISCEFMRCSSISPWVFQCSRPNSPCSSTS